MATENIVTGKYYRILKDKTNKVWDRISFWTHADDVALSSGASLSSDLSTKQTKIDKTQTDFATVETSPSTHAYTRGQCLIYNNQLYRVKAAIAVGNTLTVGTNIEAITVSTLSSMLTANTGNAFYFDYYNGKPGFYPTASKTASQFVPFGGTAFPAEGYGFIINYRSSPQYYQIQNGVTVTTPYALYNAAVFNTSNIRNFTYTQDGGQGSHLVGVKGESITDLGSGVTFSNLNYDMIFSFLGHNSGTIFYHTFTW